MKKTSSLLKDKIIIQVITFAILVLISLLTVISVDTYMQRKIMFLNGLYQNETSGKDLNDLLKFKVGDISNLMLSYTEAKTFNEMDVYEKQVNDIKESIVDLLYVIENGGEYTEEMGVNYRGLESAPICVTFIKYGKKRYNIHVMDIRAKLTEIDTFLDQFRNIVIDAIIARRSDSVQRINDVYNKKTIAIKSAEAFFTRLQESSNRLYFEAGDSEEKIKEHLDNAVEYFRQIKITMMICISMVLLGYGFVMFLNVFRTVRSRAEFSEELNRLNSSLEETVASRTEQLKKEIEIRQKKEAESTSKAQFLMDVIESLQHPFYVIDVQSYEIALANSATYDIIGCRGQTCYELTHHSNHPCDDTDHPCPLKKVLETGMPTVVEHVHIVKGGEKRHVEVHGYPVKDSSGRIVQMIEYSLDITDKKDAESALISLNARLEEIVAERTKKLENEIKQRESAEERVRNSEKHFRHLIENISDVIVIIDQNKRIKFISHSVEQMTGFSQSQMLGKNIEDMIYSVDRHSFENLYSQVLSNPYEQKTVEFRLLHSSGNWIYGEAVAKNMLNSESIGGVLINIRNTSIRKKAEENVRKLALVMEQNPNSIVLTDKDGNIEYVNPAFEKITGYSQSEVIGQKANILKTDETPVEVFDNLWTTITKGNVWQGEFVNKTKSGEHYIEHAVIAPIMDDKGEIISYLGMKENITELIRAREKAEESSRAKSIFLANMSHEIRTPLNGLMGFLQLLKDTALDTEQSEYVSTIEFSAASLLDVLNDILDLSKIESGILELNSSSVDICHHMVSTIKIHYAKAYEKGVAVYSYLDPCIPKSLKCDPVRIDQVMSNLLSNAIKFTEKDGRIMVEAKLAEETDEYAVINISVLDSGVGIAESQIPAIFEAFAQGDNSDTRKYDGTGLGLTITRNILRMMGSDIHVESTLGEGSCFSFSLKLEKTHAGTPCQKGMLSKDIFFISSAECKSMEMAKRYLDDLHEEYAILEASRDIDYPASAVVIFSDSTFSQQDADRLMDKGARVIYISDIQTNAFSSVIDSGVYVLVSPFCGASFHRVLSGDTDISSQDSKSAGKYSGKVLVTEDNQVNVKLVTLLLEKLGLDVDIAISGFESIEKFSENRYDIVLMDINMPDMDGVGTTKKMRDIEAELGRRRTPVVALTAHTLAEVTAKFKDKLDFDGYLGKPVTMNDLDVVMTQFLGDKADDEEEKSFDLNDIHKSLGLPKNVVGKLVKSFNENMIKETAKLSEALESHDYVKVKAIISSNRSAAENICLSSVTGVLDAISEAAGEEDREKVKEQLQKLESVVLDIKASL